MSLIIMAVHDTEENGRTEYTRQTMNSLFSRVDFKKHRLVVVDNDSCKKTKDLWDHYFQSGFDVNFCVITNDENLGTARAVNKGIQQRRFNEHIIKIDNDVVCHKDDWVDDMEFVIDRMPQIGILGLKRKDLGESPSNPDPDFRSRLIMVDHNPGEPWHIIEKCPTIMGTCTMINSKLLDKIGYFHQPTKYGFDDTLISERSTAAGFMNCFLHGIEIDHIDTGGNQYISWKEREANDAWEEYKRLALGYRDGSISYFHDFY